MSDKKTFGSPASKTTKIKRPSTVSLASTSRKNPSVPSKEKPQIRSKTKLNETIAGPDVSVMKDGSSNPPDFDSDYRQIAYGKFLRAMLQECLVNEQIEREETQIDVQMVQLADRFQKTMDVLDKTNRRMKDISFVVEQKRLLDLKTQQSDSFFATQDSSNPEQTLQTSLESNLSRLDCSIQSNLDKLHTKNIDFGYNKESGHQQLLDAVNEAIEGLEHIKKHSNLDLNKSESYSDSKIDLDKIEEDRFDIDGLIKDFEGKFPALSEKLIKEASDTFAQMVVKDDDDDNSDDVSDD